MSSRAGNHSTAPTWCAPPRSTGIYRGAVPFGIHFTSQSSWPPNGAASGVIVSRALARSKKLLVPAGLIVPPAPAVAVMVSLPSPPRHRTR